MIVISVVCFVWKILCLLNDLNWLITWIEWIVMCRSYALNKYAIIRREWTWIKMLVGLTERLWRQSLATTRWVVWSLIVREQLALSIDFCMNLLILNGCMNFGNDKGHDLLKQPLSQKAYPVHEWWIPCTHVELHFFDWLSWTLSLLSHNLHLPFLRL